MNHKPLRARRAPEVARAHILAAAETLLAQGGVDAVQMRAVARLAGITDAGVAHHFVDRHGLLTALIAYGGDKLRAMIDATVTDWLESEPDIGVLLAKLAGLYRQGYSGLAVALHAAGWRETGSPVLEKVVEALHAARFTSGVSAPDILHTRLVVAAFHHALATDPLFGTEFRRSAGISGSRDDGAALQLAWWISVTKRALGYDE
ncbi:TetR/AcrR family transcriptional regulator [Sphingomonas alpina]|uniref:TetR/AcrR family transcriptional regulator n=1 Tax=Sphingomonas alpina TaxID=653931 RepID=A0A7H0LMF5_9SPHN|nr:TetR/AcrR family transcriptional regulator [Sphingomonas alpina]QNQ10858.1 TetR/AcrR family transcriptional regulator [Sphingomonas alpina]